MRSCKKQTRRWRLQFQLCPKMKRKTYNFWCPADHATWGGRKHCEWKCFQCVWCQSQWNCGDEERGKVFFLNIYKAFAIDSRKLLRQFLTNAATKGKVSRQFFVHLSNFVDAWKKTQSEIEKNIKTVGSIGKKDRVKMDFYIPCTAGIQVLIWTKNSGCNFKQYSYNFIRRTVYQPCNKRRNLHKIMSRGDKISHDVRRLLGIIKRKRISLPIFCIAVSSTVQWQVKKHHYHQELQFSIHCMSRFWAFLSKREDATLSINLRWFNIFRQNSENRKTKMRGSNQTKLVRTLLLGLNLFLRFMIALSTPWKVLGMSPYNIWIRDDRSEKYHIPFITSLPNWQYFWM